MIHGPLLTKQKTICSSTYVIDLFQSHFPILILMHSTFQPNRVPLYFNCSSLPSFSEPLFLYDKSQPGNLSSLFAWSCTSMNNFFDLSSSWSFNNRFFMLFATVHLALGSFCVYARLPRGSMLLRAWSTAFSSLNALNPSSL